MDTLKRVAVRGRCHVCCFYILLGVQHIQTILYLRLNQHSVAGPPAPDSDPSQWTNADSLWEWQTSQMKQMQ